MKEYGYINEEGYLVARFIEPYTEKYQTEDGQYIDKNITVEEQEEVLRKEGWLPVDPIDHTKMDTDKEFTSVHLEPYQNGDRISYHYNEWVNPDLINDKIDELKSLLAQDDYKIIKCYECSLTKSTLPYDVDCLHQERNRIRSTINELESTAETYRSR